MIYIGIPVHNEAPTIGVLLWKIRRVFQQYGREYELLVYDDASTDATPEVLRPYTEVLPLTIIRSDVHTGYGGALNAICRAAAERTRYARRDALVTMQGDFTDQPEHIPDLVKRFEGGADIVVVEPPPADADAGAGAGAGAGPAASRRLRRFAAWAFKAYIKVPGVTDPFGSYRLYRISVLREAVKAAGGPDRPGDLVTGDGWAANAELLWRTAAVARRLETVQFAPRYDLRTRPSRVRPVAGALTLYRFGRSLRALQAAASR